MARLGEGDKRWIVEDRPDGTNVHNWHWSERDCLEWSRSLLSSLLSNLEILNGEGGLYIRTKAIDKVEGEAYVNVRKGKVIPGYELSINLVWEGEAKDVAVKVTGLVEVPYLADENAGEDPEIKVSVRDDDGPVGRRIKDAMLLKGKSILLEKIRAYVDAMSNGGPAKDELETKKASSSTAAPKAASASTTETETATTAPEQKEKAKKEKKKTKEGFKNITMTEKFYCRAKDLYDILMDENRWKGFTQSNARISREVGGQFSIFDGSINGVHEELQEGKVIVQKWRSGSWPDGLYSSVRIVFDEPEPGITIINLTQTDIPEEDKYGNSTVVENTERGWRELIFHKIRAVFGFGI
ncbi:activator of heat shock protein ATPase [Carex littledalei]|uniref:Activator of heat shock protein ATPase n=1 Tax=Carex littledalei TaxID=544730 RepID=A0A833R546_9POAL|nr:activator of heat shock protein ATPase [Carex littledalei]